MRSILNNMPALFFTMLFVIIISLALFFKRKRHTADQKEIEDLDNKKPTKDTLHDENYEPLVEEDQMLILQPEIPVITIEESISEVKPEPVVEPEVNKEKTEELTEAFGNYDPTLDLSTYKYPHLDLLERCESNISLTAEELDQKKQRFVSILNAYGIEIEHIRVTVGPTVTLYEIIPPIGVKISKIKGLQSDIALSLGSARTRVIGHMPGTNTVGIQVPNSVPDLVSMRSVLATEKFQMTRMDLPVVLGKTITNEVFIADLAKLPHLLIGGATGQGKSVTLNALLMSLLYKKHPSQLKFVLIDVNKLELSLYNRIERHFLAKLPSSSEAIITNHHQVTKTLTSLCAEMDDRYNLLKDAQVRTINEYNDIFIRRRLNPNNSHRYLPFIVVLIDEFSDLISNNDRTVELLITRIAQLGRAVGIHLVISTQRPTVNIITGTIKANFASRIAFRTASIIDSRTILDVSGAEHLAGQGDMLFSNGTTITNIQGVFVNTDEVNRITEFIGNQRGYPEAYQLLDVYSEEEMNAKMDFDASDRDSMFEDAARLIVMHQQGSPSLIQRKLKLGYNRAGRIIDQLEAAGVVGPFEGSKAREVLIPDEYQLEEFLDRLNER
jgi:S-DNA-T family DNA segregation ATPase FtsK/SpoIIIE